MTGTPPFKPSGARESGPGRATSEHIAVPVYRMEGRLILPASDLFQPGSHFDVFVEAGQDRAAFRADRRGDDHAVRLDAAQFAGSQIRNHGNLAADELLRLVVLRYASADLANFGANVHGELQEFVRADDALGRLDMAHAHFDFREIVDPDLLP